MAAQSSTTSFTESAGHRDDRDVDLVGDVLHRLVRRESRHGLGLRVDGVDRAAEVAEHEVAHHGQTDRVRTTTGTDHGDAAGAEDALDRGGLGTLLASTHDAHRRVGRLDLEGESLNALVDRSVDQVAHLAEDLLHAGVGRQDVGDESLDAALAPGLGEVLQQQLADAAALVRVLDQERDLGLVAIGVIAADADDLAVQRHDEGDPTVVVDRREPRDVLLRQRRIGREEPEVLGLVGDSGVELDEPFGIALEDGSKLGDTTVLEQDIGLPLGDGVRLGGHRDNLSGARTAWRREYVRPGEGK